MATDIETLDAAIRTAIDSEDWATALSKALQLKSSLLITPDVDQGSVSMKWDRSSVDTLIKDMRTNLREAQLDNSHGLTFTKTKHVAVED